ncbi:anti-phage ZorAB system protein ZorA [uncultured Pseudoalteromonas sp.]|uniref:anti-phage ZorAB system protein ZorA n=1 Tax=uncultured Pseudoalteromonas sp. TaxID=114053 RepID=UPI00259208B4|nr:anti-phage ZorAB system protein ZorA [uncultured Pseudoalteromonas sp.]
MEKLAWLLPQYGDFFSQPFDTQLSTGFVSVLLIITFVFIAKSIRSFSNAKSRIKWLSEALAQATENNVADMRIDLFSGAKKKLKEDKQHSVAHLWLEFDETLIEVRKDGNTLLYNTLDAAHFFNTSTLAKGVTENRLIAAVPGFLTAIGVIGTFVGLQIGLSEMNISADVTVDEMKSGVSAVIGGAKIAFMTSVWGVALSVCFNFVEKLLEQNIRTQISVLQDDIDGIFPRLSPESQLQIIANNSAESRESLQGLAEKIGEKMQESMLSATQGISEALTSTLNDIMAPAIDKFVNGASEGNEKALESLLEKFMDGFGAQGAAQQKSMEAASNSVNDAVDKMNTTLHDFVKGMDASQEKAGQREQALIEGIAQKVNVLVTHNEEQTQALANILKEQASDLQQQTRAITQSTEQLLMQIKTSMDTHEQSSQRILEQGKSLQEGMAATIKSSLEASTSMRDSASQMSESAENMKLFGSHMKDAGNQLSGAIAQAANTTKELANQNQLSAENMEKLRTQLLEDVSQFKALASHIDGMITSAQSTFDALKSSQKEYLAELKLNVSDLSDKMTQLLSDYAERANSQTTEHLNVWAKSTTQYAESMNTAARALSGVVDEIQDKVGG